MDVGLIQIDHIKKWPISLDDPIDHIYQLRNNTNTPKDVPDGESADTKRKSVETCGSVAVTNKARDDDKEYEAAQIATFIDLVNTNRYFDMERQLILLHKKKPHVYDKVIKKAPKDLKRLLTMTNFIDSTINGKTKKPYFPVKHLPPLEATREYNTIYEGSKGDIHECKIEYRLGEKDNFLSLRVSAILDAPVSEMLSLFLEVQHAPLWVPLLDNVRVLEGTRMNRSMHAHIGSPFPIIISNRDAVVQFCVVDDIDKNNTYYIYVESNRSDEVLQRQRKKCYGEALAKTTTILNCDVKLEALPRTSRVDVKHMLVKAEIIDSRRVKVLVLISTDIFFSPPKWFLNYLAGDFIAKAMNSIVTKANDIALNRATMSNIKSTTDTKSTSRKRKLKRKVTGHDKPQMNVSSWPHSKVYSDILKDNFYVQFDRRLMRFMTLSGSIDC